MGSAATPAASNNISFFMCDPRPVLAGLKGRTARLSIEAVLALYPAHRAGARPHDDAFGGHLAAAALDAFEQRAVGNAGGGEDAVALGELGEVVDLVEILDAPFARAGALVVV